MSTPVWFFFSIIGAVIGYSIGGVIGAMAGWILANIIAIGIFRA